MEVIRYQISDEFLENLGVRLSVDTIDKAVADFCEAAYVYPETGDSRASKTSRFKFVCLNIVAINLAHQGLLTGLEAPRRAVDAMRGLDHYNHESVFIVSKWLITHLRDELLAKIADRVVEGEIYRALVQYAAIFMERVDRQDQPEFRLHKVTLQTALAKLEKTFPELNDHRQRAANFEEMLNFATAQVQAGNHGPNDCLMTFTDLAEKCRYAKTEYRQMLLPALMRMADGLKAIRIAKEVCQDNKPKLSCCLFLPLTYIPNDSVKSKSRLLQKNVQHQSSCFC